MIRYVPYVRITDARVQSTRTRKRRVSQYIAVKLKEDAAMLAALRSEPVVINSIRDPRIESYEVYAQQQYGAASRRRMALGAISYKKMLLLSHCHYLNRKYSKELERQQDKEKTDE